MAYKKIKLAGELTSTAEAKKVADAGQVKDLEWNGVDNASGLSEADKAKADAGDEDFLRGKDWGTPQSKINEALRKKIADVSSGSNGTQVNLDAHIKDKTNPHGVTAAQVGAFNKVQAGGTVISARTNQTLKVSGDEHITVTARNADNTLIIGTDIVPASKDEDGLLTGEDYKALQDLEKGTVPNYNGGGKAKTIDAIADDRAGTAVGKLSVSYDTAAKQILLKSGTNTLGDPIDVSDFVKDGMLQRVVVFGALDVTVTSGGVATYSEEGDDGKTLTYQFSIGTGYTTNDVFLGFVWNTDAGDIDPTFAGVQRTTAINLGEFFQPYTAGNGIDITKNKVSAVVKTGEKYLTVDGSGLATKGIGTIEAGVAANKAKLTKHEETLTTLTQKTSQLSLTGETFSGKAVNDGEGNRIADTYATKKELTTAKGAVAAEAAAYTDSRTGIRYIVLTDSSYSASTSYPFPVVGDKTKATNGKIYLEQDQIIVDVHLYKGETVNGSKRFREVLCDMVYNDDGNGRPGGAPVLSWYGIKGVSADSPLIISYRIVQND